MLLSQLPKDYKQKSILVDINATGTSPLSFSTLPIGAKVFAIAIPNRESSDDTYSNLLNVNYYTGFLAITLRLNQVIILDDMPLSMIATANGQIPTQLYPISWTHENSEYESNSHIRIYQNVWGDKTRLQLLVFYTDDNPNC